MEVFKTLTARWAWTTAVAITLADIASAEDNESTDSKNETSPTPAPEVSGGSGTSAEIVVLATMLCAAVVGNMVFAALFFFRRKASSSPSPQNRHRDTDAELGNLRRHVETQEQRRKRAEAELKAELKLRHKAEADRKAEHRRRVEAETLIMRADGAGIRPGSDFPSVGDVIQDVESRLVDDAHLWADKACAIGGSAVALPAAIRSVLRQTLKVCRGEVARSLDERRQGLSVFLGGREPVSLSGKVSMNLDTQDVLYECLRKRYQTIVPVEPAHMQRLARTIVKNCAADGISVETIIFNDAWPSFNALMKHFILLVVTMNLQNPPLSFKNEDLDTNPQFNAEIHRNWAPSLEAPHWVQCSIVFPVILMAGEDVPDGMKAGVVHVPVK